MVLAFIEQKEPDLEYISRLLDECAAVNRWANRGPLYIKMQNAFMEHTNAPKDSSIVPVASGGIALESIAQLKALRAGRKLRWVVSAFSFWNLGRGHFHDVLFLDCDDQGRIDLEALKALDPSSYDGIILTNSFGLAKDLDAYANFAKATGKHLILDNAAGIHSEISNLRWQAFSLHHTKPYGVGEGGLALVPSADAEDLYSLLDYGPRLHGSEHWVQNGKLSEISCAFLLDRLSRVSEWAPRYLNQRLRVIELAASFGMKPLSLPETSIPLMSIPLLASKAVPLEVTGQTSHMILAKYYKPLKDLPKANEVFERIVNVPCHADTETLSDDQIESDLSVCAAAVS